MWRGKEGLHQRRQRELGIYRSRRPYRLRCYRYTFRFVGLCDLLSFKERLSLMSRVKGGRR